MSILHNWGPAVIGLVAVALSGCADRLPCDINCGPGDEALAVQPIDRDEIFGRQYGPTLANVGAPRPGVWELIVVREPLFWEDRARTVVLAEGLSHFDCMNAHDAYVLSYPRKAVPICIEQ